MYVAGVFDPSSALSGQFNTQLPIRGKFVAYNESSVGVTFIYSDGTSDYCPAQSANGPFVLPTATPIVTWSQQNVLVSSSTPLSECTIVCYQPGEKIPGTFPISLNRLTNVGNPIPMTTSATSIVNSGNPAGTPIVTGQVSGDGGNAVLITNDAQVTFGDGLHPAVVNVAGTENVTTVNAGTINVTTANLQTIVVNTILDLLAGSLTRVGRATGSNTQVVTHNWGHQADIVIPYYNGNFGTPPSQSLAVYNENANSFTVKGEVGYTWTVFFLAF